MDTDGSLYELFARGKKDNFFIKDSPESVFLFDNRYNPQSQSIYELRRTVPLTAPAWGRPLEFELEIAGDLSKEHTLIITLPSWVPSTITGPVQDQSGKTYSYIPNIAYMLFEKIQFFQDSLLLQEVSGDSLYYKSLLDSSLNQGILNQILTNEHDGPLRLPMPIPGFDNGLPALLGQTFRLKVWLRKLDKLLTSPIPEILYYKTSADAELIPFNTLSIAQPVILLESKHVYLSSKEQQEYKDIEKRIIYKRFYENIYTFSEHEYAKGGIVSRRIEARHPSGKVFFYFRKPGNLNSIINTDSSGPSFWSSLRLLVAGQDRETNWTPMVWRNIVQHAKANRTLPEVQEIGLIDWTLGDVHERRLPYNEVPEGTLNFTTADRPTFLINLNPTPGNKSEMRAVVESWAMLIVENGRVRMLSVN